MNDTTPKRTASAEMLPCPFCGGHARMVGTNIHWCRCSRCRAEGPTESTEIAAIATWNIRTQRGDVVGLRAENARLRDAERAMRERCAAECEAQAEAFMSEEYKQGQPASSLFERFACKECAAAIRALPLSINQDTTHAE